MFGRPSREWDDLAEQAQIDHARCRGMLQRAI